MEIFLYDNKWEKTCQRYKGVCKRYKTVIEGIFLKEKIQHIVQVND